MATLDDISKQLDQISLRQDHFMREVETIKRGIYGDEQNGVKGLIATDREQHNRIKKLEEFKARTIYTAGGMWLLIMIVWETFKDKIKLLFS